MNIEARTRSEIVEAIPLPFGDDSFSLIFTRFSFRHLINALAVLREMIRVRAPGGRVAVVDVALPRDPSHTRALTMNEFSAMLQEVGLQEIKTCYHTVEVEIENQIKASFPNPGDDEKIRRILQKDLGRDALGVAAQRGEEIYFAYPILILVGRK
jgi:ubiquinone/menaquinone biosynthesis C-methylase UbiE